MGTDFLAFLSDLLAAALFETWGAVGIAALLGVASCACGLFAVHGRLGSPALRALAGFPLFFLGSGTIGILVYLAGGTVRLGLAAVLALSAGLVLAALWRGTFQELLRWRALVLLAALLLLGFLLAFFGWGETADGTIRVMSGSWGDGALHTLIAEAFLRRNGPDLSMPAFAGEQLREPFGYDFGVAMLRAAGFTVGGASTLPATAFLACVLGWSAGLAARLAGNGAARSAGSAAVLLVLAFSGLQWADMAQRTGSWTPTEFFGVHEPAWDKSEELGLVWANHLNTFASQKHLLLASAFLVVLVAGLLDAIQREEQKRRLLPFALAMGLLPLFHAHAFLVAGLLWISAVLVSRSRVLLGFGVLAVLVATPVVLWQATLFTRAGFLSLSPGWMAGDGLLGWLSFWLKNLGLFLPLAVLAVARGYRRERRSVWMLVLPAVAIFVLANLIQFQPYRWDNFKLFLLAWMLLLPLVVAEMYRWRFVGARPLAWSLIFVMSLTTLADVATHLQFRAAYPVYTSADRRTARELDAELPSDAVVLARTDTIHNHPLTLTGRTLLSGYGGWLWTRNYAWQERARLLEALRNASPSELCALVAGVEVTHLVDQAFAVQAVREACRESVVNY